MCKEGCVSAPQRGKIGKKIKRQKNEESKISK